MNTTIKELVKQGAQKLSNLESPVREARLLLAYALEKKYEDLFFHEEDIILESEIIFYEQLLKRRTRGEPLSKIQGIKEFWGHPFKVTYDTLDPRPESETLIEAVLENFPEKDSSYRILDLGTGSGCLILSLLSEYKNATGVAVDQSLKALHVASFNASQMQLSQRISFICTSWTRGIKEKFDIIISNPPYIDPCEDLDLGVLAYDPVDALFAENHGLKCYEEIMETLPCYMKKEGLAFFEIGYNQNIVNIVEKSDCFIHSVKCDLLKIPRCVVIGKNK